MKEIKEIGFSFPETTKYIPSEKGLKVRVQNGVVSVEYASVQDAANKC